MAKENGKLYLVEDLGLVGVYEAHELLGVERSRLARWISDNDIDAPIYTLRCGPIWLREQIDAKLQSMYEAAGAPYGDSVSGREQWATERRARREARRGSRSGKRKGATSSKKIAA